MRRMKYVSKAILLLLCVLIALPGFVIAAPASAPSDINKHWAEKEMRQWIDKGLLSGYSDGTYKPDQSISRAEFFTLVNRSFHFSQEASVSFTDLSASHWAVSEIARAQAAGYVSGYPDGTIHPDQQISREEAAVVLKNVLKLQENAAGAETFKDAAQFAGWSKGSIGALAAKGYLSGYEDGTFKPNNAMTRAEIVVLLDRIQSNAIPVVTYDHKGTFGPATGVETIRGNVVISAQGVTLRNTVIEGNLLLAESIGEGDVFLKNVTVKGITTVNGGGANSVHIEDSVLLTVIVNKADGSVRIVAEGATSVQQFTVQSSALLEARGTSTITDVILSSVLPPHAQVTLAGQFNTVDVQATSVRVSLTEGSIQQLTVAREAGNSTINVGTGASIAELILNAAASVTGNGTIERAAVNANGSTFERTPSNITTGNGISVGSTSGGGASGGGSSSSDDDSSSGDDDSSNDDDSSSDDDTVTETVYGFEGRIVDVQNQPVAGMTIHFRRGLDNKDGTIVATVVTDSNGRYSVDLPPGIYTGELSKPGFITTYLVGVSASNVRNTNENATAIRVAAAHEIRIVLTWGERPRDLDSHLVGPIPNGGVFHTWYADRIHSVSGAVYADLDHDDVTSYGPETTTIRQLVDGTYRFYVHNFSGETNMRESGAHIEVYVGATTTPAKTYDIPTGAGSELYWTVFEMNVSNGLISSFTDINQFYANESAAQGHLANGIGNTAITSAVYSIDQNVREILVPANTPVESFKAGLSVSPGTSLEVYQSDGTTVRTGFVMNGDKVIARSFDGLSSRTYTVSIINTPTVTSLTYSPAGPIVFYDLTPLGVTVSAAGWDGTVTDVTYDANMVYISQNLNIAAVAPNGVITPGASGSTVISAVYGGMTLEIPVTVILAPALTQNGSTLESSGLISGAEVRVYDASNNTVIGSTYTVGHNGAVSIPSLPAGSYYIVQSYQGFTSRLSNTITITN
ncbi:SLH domain-containing protein [Paenibacillus naphthalenovorans]|uniref:SLH domain-containing protein n=2 Tax=Paenibacillus naphthalenovorans TaxID=162209 RepID=A0A0U2VXH6_9BACL|nr:SLH domain-containing protein [Paenibacillus naphthalenovorans]